MKIGDKIRVRACKADGSMYRSWHTIVEALDENLIITISPAGGLVEDLKRPAYQLEHILRSYYWLDKFYNLIEAFDPQGNLVEIYINIAAPPEFEDGGLSFKDHELDVSRFPPAAARIIDEDEFAAAAIKYHYTREFQSRMYLAAEEALELANTWKTRPVPPGLIVESNR